MKCYVFFCIIPQQDQFPKYNIATVIYDATFSKKITNKNDYKNTRMSC